MRRIPRRWTPQEDLILLEKTAKDQHQCEYSGSGTTISWSSVANALAERNAKDCRKRWYKLTSMRKGLWTADEDEKLLQAVQNHGTQWARVATMVGTRNADQCAKRWQQCLDPSLDRSEWTPEKDAQLILAVQRYGTNWKNIRQFVFPGRSTTNLKNRHIALVRQGMKNSDIDSLLVVTDGTTELNSECMSVDQGMDESKQDESSQSPSAFEFDLSGFSTKRSVPTPSNQDSSRYDFSMDWQLQSLPVDLVQTDKINPNHTSPPFDDFLRPVFDQHHNIAKAESALWHNPVNIDQQHYHGVKLPTRVMSPWNPPGSETAQTTPSFISSTTPASEENEVPDFAKETCRKESKESLPQKMASTNDGRAPQMTVTIENPDVQTMASLLEVLTKTKGKVTMSMNPSRGKSSIYRALE